MVMSCRVYNTFQEIKYQFWNQQMLKSAIDNFHHMVVKWSSYRNLGDKKRGRVSANEANKAIGVAEQLKELLIELDPDKIEVDKSE